MTAYEFAYPNFGISLMIAVPLWCRRALGQDAIRHVAIRLPVGSGGRPAQPRCKIGGECSFSRRWTPTRRAICWTTAQRRQGNHVDEGACTGAWSARHLGQCYRPGAIPGGGFAADLPALDQRSRWVARGLAGMVVALLSDRFSAYVTARRWWSMADRHCTGQTRPERQPASPGRRKGLIARFVACGRLQSCQCSRDVPGHRRGCRRYQRCLYPGRRAVGRN